MFLAASWGVVEVADFLTEQVGLPDWTPVAAFGIMVLGAPAIVATAYFQKGISPGAAAPEPVAPQAPVHPDPAPARALRRIFSWRNVLLAGFGAFALLGMSVAGYFVLWSSGVGSVGSLVAQGVFEEGEPILLADFQDRSGQGLAPVVTEAIRVDLQESSVIDLLPPSYVQEGKARMGMEPAAPLNADAARELAIRDGIKAVIQGEVARVGSDYLLTASLVASESGEILKAFRVPVESEDELLEGIDRLSQDIREKSGESLRSIKQGSGLEEVTTASLEALRRYTSAVEAFDEGRYPEARTLLDQALELDPEFAQAWRKLSVLLSNLSVEPELMREAATRAYELRDRLTEREALLAEAWYLDVAEDNQDGSLETYRALLDRYPTDPTALNNLSIGLQRAGRWNETTEIVERLAERPEGLSASQMYLYISLLWYEGRRDEASAWADSLQTRFPKSPAAQTVSLDLLAGRGQWAELARESERYVESFSIGNANRMNYCPVVGAARIAAGDWEGGWSWLDDALREGQLHGTLNQWISGCGSMAAGARYWYEGPQATVGFVEEILRVVDPADHPGATPFNAFVGTVLHAAGDTLRGDRFWGEFVAGLPQGGQGDQFAMDRESDAMFRAMGTGDFDQASVHARRLYQDLTDCGEMCPENDLWGRVLEGAGEVEQAILRYRLFLKDTHLGSHTRTGYNRGAVMARLARLLEEERRPAEAREVWQDLADEYSDPNGPLVELVREAEARLEALSGPAADPAG